MPKINARMRRSIKRQVKSNSSTTCGQIATQCNISYSWWTIARALKAMKMKFLKRKHRPSWNKRHIESREKFGQRHQTWNEEWKSVIFSDEKKFNLDGPDGYQKYWHCLGDEHQCYSKRQCGGGGLMVWGAFGFGGQIDLQFPQGRLSATSYQQMLESNELKDKCELIGAKISSFSKIMPTHAVSV